MSPLRLKNTFLYKNIFLAYTDSHTDPSTSINQEKYAKKIWKGKKFEINFHHKKNWMDLLILPPKGVRFINFA